MRFSRGRGALRLAGGQTASPADFPREANGNQRFGRTGRPPSSICERYSRLISRNFWLIRQAYFGYVRMPGFLLCSFLFLKTEWRLHCIEHGRTRTPQVSRLQVAALAVGGAGRATFLTAAVRPFIQARQSNCTKNVSTYD